VVLSSLLNGGLASCQNRYYSLLHTLQKLKRQTCMISITETLEMFVFCFRNHNIAYDVEYVGTPHDNLYHIISCV